MVSKALAKRLNDADLLVALRANQVDTNWIRELKGYEDRVAKWEEPRLRALGGRFIEDMRNIRHGVVAADLKEGLTASFSALLVNDDNTSTFMVDRLNASPAEHPPNFRGLPNEPLHGVVSIGDAATKNAEIMTVLNRLEFIELQPLLNEFYQPATDNQISDDLVDFLVNGARKTTGARAAVYGDQRIVVIVDSKSPAEVADGLTGLFTKGEIDNGVELVTGATEIGGVSVDHLYWEIKNKNASRPNPVDKLVGDAVNRTLGYGINIAQLPNHVVVTSEPDVELLSLTIENIRENLPGLASVIATEKGNESEIPLADFRFHAGGLTGFINLRANKPVVNAGPIDAKGLSSLFVRATSQELFAELHIPIEELIEVIKQPAP